jgi:hypothetical protein
MYLSLVVVFIVNLAVGTSFSLVIISPLCSLVGSRNNRNKLSVSRRAHHDRPLENMRELLQPEWFLNENKYKHFKTMSKNWIVTEEPGYLSAFDNLIVE